MQDLDRLAGACRPFDVDRPRFAERDFETELVRQRRLDDFLLNLTVERDRELLPGVVLPDVDQRVLLGELHERDAERCALIGLVGNDDRLQGRRGEVMI